MTFRTSLTLILTAAGLSACVSAPPSYQYSRSMPQPQRPFSPVDGEWADANGIVSTFQNGTFSTRTTDGTNTLLASGNYVQKSDRLFEINMTSLVRNTQSRVNCALVTQSQLNCTSDAGGQFSLSRRG
ncbi:hypothetical protein NOF55_06860 [Rhizobiaceae bacterium BDR2-2]|uniref:Outer membrane lipoprotein omp10 n=1 Tax=Ectorhizobium quercum TaxID=2965071 RepID=A0AAE3MYR9_9HYPH|nr:outer membrane lipoprotein Omp10 [Ectorhizobium quercum]MCX8996822.1 hypothetical protein [Ectorhizobium quercum]